MVNGDLLVEGNETLSADDVRLAIKLDSPVGRAHGRQSFDVEALIGNHVDKWWQDQK